MALADAKWTNFLTREQYAEGKDGWTIYGCKDCDDKSQFDEFIADTVRLVLNAKGGGVEYAKRENILNSEAGAEFWQKLTFGRDHVMVFKDVGEDGLCELSLYGGEFKLIPEDVLDACGCVNFRTDRPRGPRIEETNARP